MIILNILQTPFFDPTVNRGAWIMLLLCPIILIATVIFPKLLGKKGSILSSIASLIPVIIAIPTFLWANFMVQSAIANMPASDVELTLFCAISMALPIIYLGSLLSLLLLLFTTLFTSIFKNSRGNVVIAPVLLMLFIGTVSGWVQRTIIRYDAMANSADTEGIQRSKLMESIFFSDITINRIEEHKKYRAYALRFSITPQTVYNSFSERTEEIDQNESLKVMISDQINEFYSREEQLVRHGILSSMSTEQTILFEYTKECVPFELDSSFTATLISTGFISMEVRHENNIKSIDLRVVEDKQEDLVFAN